MVCHAAQPSLNKAFIASPARQASSQMKEGGGSGGSAMAVFVAKFDYNPETDSPNDNPSSELPITTGEYIYVYGDTDEVRIHLTLYGRWSGYKSLV